MRVPFRGVIVFLLVWVILWVVPAFRNQTLKGWQPQSPLTWSPSISDEDIASGLKADPNNSLLRSEQLQSREWADGPQAKAQFFASYDALIAEHPTDVGLRRNRLRLSTRGNIVPSKYTDHFVHPPFGNSDPPRWLSPRELQEVVTQARSAQKVEPSDGFFPWIEAMALWGLGREEGSISALNRAGRCSNFNDGSLDEARQRFAYLNRVRPLDWDEKVQVLWSALLPHFAGMRNLAREICYSGMERYRAGDKAEAWRRWEIALKAGQALRLGQSRGSSSTLIGQLVGEAIEQVAWGVAAEGAAGYKPKRLFGGGSTRASSEQRARESLAAFVGAAKRDGRQDLVRWVEQDGREIEARRAKLVNGKSLAKALTEELGWTTPQARTTIQLRWIGVYASLWALIGGAGWLLSLLVSRGGRDSRVATSTVVSLSAFFGALWVGLGVLALVDGAGSQSFTQIMSLSGGDNAPGRPSWLIDWDGGFWWVVGLTFIAAALGREWGASRQANAENAGIQRIKGARLWKWVGFVSWTLALLLSVMLWFDGRQNVGLDGDAIVLGFGWLGCLGIGTLAAWQNQPLQGEKRGALLVAISVAMSLVLFVLTGRAYHSDTLSWVCVMLGVLTFALWIWIGRRGLWSRSRLTTNLEVGGRVLANVAMILAVGYLVASMALLPTRIQLNERVDEYVRMGEVAWLSTHGR